MLENLGKMKCLRCRGPLVTSGKEPTRLVCAQCNQAYHVVLQLIPIDAPAETERLLDQHAEPSRRTE